MVAKAKGLGRGFESLIPTDVIAEEFDVTSEVDGKVSELRELKLEDIVRDEGQPRKHFDKVALDELAASIQEHGRRISVRSTSRHGRRESCRRRMRMFKARLPRAGLKGLAGDGGLPETSDY